MNTARVRALLIATAISPFAAATPAAAETFQVTGQTDVTGLCTGTQCASIRQALASAQASAGPDTISVPAGEYQLTQGRLDVDSEVTIAGAGVDQTVIRGGGGDRVFFVNAVANATLTRLTMRDGDVVSGDGGNLLNAGTVVLDHVRVTNGEGAWGGGVANDGGTMTVRQSLIDGNHASQGSGLANLAANGPGRLTVSDTTIARNQAGYRGAVLSSGTGNETLLQRVTIHANLGGDGPGGVVNVPGGSVRVQGSIIWGNLPYGDCDGALTSEGANLSAQDCGLAGAGDLQDVDPQLSASGGDYAPAPTSPAVDRFPCAGGDRRDVTRPQGTACDAGAIELDQEPDTVLGGDASGFTFGSPEPGVTFQCAIAGVTEFAPCSSPYVPPALGPGTYTLLVRAVDAAGRPDPTPAARTFTVAAQPVVQTPTPTPSPAPEFNRTVVVTPLSGTVRIRRPGSSRYVVLEQGAELPLGTLVDTRRGRIELTSIPARGGRPQKAVFYAGIFRIGQSRGYTELRLTEQLAPCSSRARAAQRKPKTRKLWGDGKGKFRTRGRYSAATVRGTKWLVQDGCRYTRTRVTEGSVSVRDAVRKRTIIVRKGRSYTARARR